MARVNPNITWIPTLYVIAHFVYEYGYEYGVSAVLILFEVAFFEYSYDRYGINRCPSFSMRFFEVSSLISFATALQYAQAADVNPKPPLTWAEASEKAGNFVSQLSTPEKVGLVTGSYGSGLLPCVGTIAAIERLGFDGLCLSDGPAGVARSDGVSVFASGITVAATWDRRLMYERGLALGQEFRAKGSHVHLGCVSFQ
ncbi:hypothetical protein N7444_010402 [Penicillium canescens]|nr:hypothetical protein N7444_010402 [Penicillium canescens]